MLYEIDDGLTHIKSVESFSIKSLFQKNEKSLESLITKMIGDSLFPELLVFGNERPLRKEPDIFAINKEGDLVVFELKVDGEFDRSKVLQAMEYAQRFSHWKYNDLNSHFKKCFPNDGELIDRYEQSYGGSLEKNDFNRKQKIIIISRYSEISIAEAIKYWHKQGVDIEEYYYRFYKIGDKKLIELSNERSRFDSTGYNCWINTCSRHFGNSKMLEMIRGKKAAAYGDRAYLIDTLLNKAHVFIYQNGYGIIGAGIGTAKLEILNGTKDDDAERAVYLSNFIHGVDLNTEKIIGYISPSELRSIFQRDFYFANTIVPLSKEEGLDLYKLCQSRFSMENSIISNEI